MFAYYLDLAVRSLKRNQVLTALMIVAIAVGIGASMTTLTVMHVLSGDPLPGKSARIFFPQVDPTPADWYRPSHPLDVMDDRSAMDLWRAHRAARQALVAQSPVKISAPGVNRPPLILTLQSTTSDFFPMFDVPFAYGGAWTPADETARAHVAVISSDLNDKLFDGKNSVGKTLRVRDSDVQIVGVLKPWRPTPLFYDVMGGFTGNGYDTSHYATPEDVFMPFPAALEVNDGNFLQMTCWGNGAAVRSASSAAR
jgi:putative ABC transport system permease protein